MRKFLEKTLAALEGELKLPHELDPLDSPYDDDLAPGIPMKVKFSIEEVDLNAPEMVLLKGSLTAWAVRSFENAGAQGDSGVCPGPGAGCFSMEDLNEDLLGEVCFLLPVPVPAE